ncbi:MAG: leucine-rich repeat serine threonine-protein kinase [Paramarteilia canceri]
MLYKKQYTRNIFFTFITFIIPNIFQAAKKQNYGVCKYLINQGANVNAKTISHNTPLHYAAEISDGEICRLLVKS